MTIDLIIYDGVTCCTSGLCGPEPDQELIEFNNTLKKLEKEFKDLNVKRVSMAFDMASFIENKKISQLVKENGIDILPITMINENIIAKLRYPKYDKLKKELEIIGGSE